VSYLSAGEQLFRVGSNGYPNISSSEKTQRNFLSESGDHALCDTVQYLHGLVNYVDTKAKWCHLKKLTCKGLCGRSLSEFID
jgi:hypothetical protein